MDKKIIEDTFSAAGIEGVTDGIVEKFVVFADELMEWNKKANLTAITIEREIAVKHFVDSLAALKTDSVSHCETIIDIGSGGGFPGLPIKFMRNAIKLTLVESNNKKADFLDYIIDKLKIKDCQVLRDRAEVLSRSPKHREKYDCCLIRALSAYPIAMEVCSSLVSPQGILLYYSSQKQTDAAKSNKQVHHRLSLKIADIFNYSLEGDMGEHSIITVKKLWKTDKKYPRDYAKIKKKPL